MILTRLEDDTIRVNVIPRKLNESENDALTTPLSVAGTAEKFDAECLPRWSSSLAPISN